MILGPRTCAGILRGRGPLPARRAQLSREMKPASSSKLNSYNDAFLVMNQSNGSKVAELKVDEATAAPLLQEMEVRAGLKFKGRLTKSSSDPELRKICQQSALSPSDFMYSTIRNSSEQILLVVNVMTLDFKNGHIGAVGNGNMISVESVGEPGIASCVQALKRWQKILKWK